MNNQIIKTRRLTFTTTIPASEHEALLKRIQVEDGVINCSIAVDHLTLQYDLNLTSLEILLPVIETELENLNIKLRNDLLHTVNISFICFIETNQRDNIYQPSSWHLRWQNIYLALAEQAHKNRDIKPIINK